MIMIIYRINPDPGVAAYPPPNPSLKILRVQYDYKISTTARALNRHIISHHYINYSMIMINYRINPDQGVATYPPPKPALKILQVQYDYKSSMSTSPVRVRVKYEYEISTIAQATY